MSEAHISKQEFATRLLELIGEQGGTAYRFDPEAFRLIALEDEAQVNLGNLYEEHCALPADERADHLLRVAAVCGGFEADLPETFDAVKQNLRPKIWTRSTFAMMELRQRLKGEETLDLPLYPLGSHLYLSLVFDTENAMRSIANGELEAWGVTFYEALEIACENLDETTMAIASMGDGFYSSVSGDNYDSSRVLLLDRIRNLDVQGDHVAMVPQRDAMFVAGSTDEFSLKAMIDLTREAMENEPRPLSPLPLKLQDGEWVDWMPPRNHVLRPQFDELELRFLAGMYAEQKELLLLLMEQGESMPFVATLSAIQEEESEKLSSYAVWGRSVDTLLPQAQFLVFVDDSGMQASGEWRHVMSIVGDLVTPDESYYPVRYRVTEFPTDKQLAEIGTTEPFTD